MKSFWKNYKFLLGVLILVIFLRLPSLFEPYSYGDEGIYLTLGEAVRQGLTLYRDIHDNKPPLLYLLAASAGSLFWFRFLLLTANLATIYLFFLLTKILFPAKVKAQKIALVIFSLLSTLPLIEGNIANAEIFMLLPIIGAVFLFFSQKPILKSCFLVGVLFSLATLFKVPAAFDFLAVLIFLIFFQERKRISDLVSHVSYLLLGFFLPILITIWYFWPQGALNQYLTAAFFQNLPYLSSWGKEAQVGFANLDLILRSGLVFGFLVFLWLKQKTIGQPLTFLSLWFAFSGFAALLSARPYPHYLIQILPSFSLLVAILFITQLKIQEKILASSLLGILIFSFFYFRFWAYPVFSYYQNFVAFVLKQKTQEEYFQNFNSKVPQTYKIAKFLVGHTGPQERVFIWGDSAVVYALARRLPVGRYTASYHIIDFDGYKETIEALEKERPRFVIDLHDEPRPFPELKTFLSQNYLFYQKIQNAQIFRLAP